MANDISKSWFAVFNNPSDHGYEGTPEQVCERLKQEWIDNSETRSGAWAYCISADGLHHVHMVLCDDKSMRFNSVKRTYCQGMHFEATKGTKKQADDYINKRGAFEEKGETIEYITYYGEIKGRQGHRTDLEDYFDRLRTGETPSDIVHDTPKAYARLSLLKQMFYDIRSQNTPIVRDVKVYWHTGGTGSGKSYERVLLANEVGEQNIYYLTAFNSGAFDNYNGQPVLWIEDYRGEFRLQELLRLLDVYKAELPARFSNSKALWTEVHITSVLTPRECYHSSCVDDIDRIEQLLRRITSICYHFKVDNEYYKLYFESSALRSDMEKEVYKFKDFLGQWVTLLSDTEVIDDET